MNLSILWSYEFCHPYTIHTIWAGGLSIVTLVLRSRKSRAQFRLSAFFFRDITMIVQKATWSNIHSLGSRIYHFTKWQKDPLLPKWRFSLCTDSESPSNTIQTRISALKGWRISHKLIEKIRRPQRTISTNLLSQQHCDILGVLEVVMFEVPLLKKKGIAAIRSLMS